MARVFVSYSHADRQLVRKLAQDLTNYAVEVWLDEWQLAIDSEIKAGLDEGIAAYDYFFIVLSKASVASDWVRHELDVALQKEAAGRSGLVLPILLDRVSPPAGIANRELLNQQHGLRGVHRVSCKMGLFWRESGACNDTVAFCWRSTVRVRAVYRRARILTR